MIEFTTCEWNRLQIEFVDSDWDGTYVATLSGEDDEGGEDEGDEGERCDRGEELVLEERLFLEENESSSSH